MSFIKLQNEGLRINTDHIITYGHNEPGPTDLLTAIATTTGDVYSTFETPEELDALIAAAIAQNRRDHFAAISQTILGLADALGARLPDQGGDPS